MHRTRRAALVSIALTAASSPAAALAQSPTPAPAPAAPAAPVQTAMRIGVERVGGRRATVLTGARVRVRGFVDAYVAGETIIVRFFRGRRELRAKRVALQPLAGGGATFLLSYRATSPGTISVRAAHAATPALGALDVSAARTFDVLPSHVGPRSGSRSVRALQRLLRQRGYVVGRRGSFDARTARAVLALRKVTGMARTTAASRTVMRRLARGGGRFRVRRADHGRHIEADLARQVVALIDRGRVQRIYPMSSGKPSTPSPRGSFRVYSKAYGTNAKGMVHSSYFLRGFALHGYYTVPVYPASHGCLRVPIPDALSLFKWIRIGTPVDVYG